MHNVQDTAPMDCLNLQCRPRAKGLGWLHKVYEQSVMTSHVPILPYGRLARTPNVVVNLNLAVVPRRGLARPPI